LRWRVRPWPRTNHQRLPRRLEKEARREGRIRWSSSTNLDRVEPLLNAWKKKYPGIRIEYHRVTGRKLADLAITEHRAGRHEIDILGTSAVTFLSLKEAGVIRPYISPETGAFRSGMRDPQGYWVSEYSNVLAIICNKNRVKSPPRDWQSFTDQKWKSDFSLDTERFQWFGALQKIYGGERAKQLMLAYRQNGALARRGGTLQVQLVAAGEYSCALAAYLNSAYLLGEKGAPLIYAVPEPVMLSPTTTMMTRFPPDPYGAMLLYDYIMSPEGMSHLIRNNALFPSRKNMPVVDDIKALEGKPLHLIEVEDQSRRYKEISEIYQELVEK
jgi:iron(III) transport system substrate-binding protein